MHSKIRNTLLFAGLCLALVSSATLRAEIIADSVADWDPAGVQGTNGWTYGYYNVTDDAQNGDGIYQTSDMIEFINDGSGTAATAPLPRLNQNPVDTNHWTGNSYDFQGNPPWTFINQAGGHPNGDNQEEEHHAVKRWTSDYAGEVQIQSFIKKNNGNGNGVTAIVYHNGTEIDRITIAGANQAGQSSGVLATIAVGDLIEIHQSPEGADGLHSDGSDSSDYNLVIDNSPPDDDGDGVPNAADNCPNRSNEDQADSDEDGAGDVCDNCPDDANAGQEDHDNDGQGNVCDDSLLAHSILDFTADGTSNNGWDSGWYNLTTDGDSTYSADDVTIFSVEDHWRGSSWRLVPSNAPWTFVAAENTHPNGSNSAPNEEHWAVRRWTSNYEGEVLIRANGRAQNTNGGGTRINLYINGQLRDFRQLAGNDPGQKIVHVTNVAVGDVIDLALTPENVDGTRADGADGTFTSMSIDAYDGVGVPVGSPLTYVLLGGLLLAMGTVLLRKVQPAQAS